jgi:hypothetical protein
MNKVKFSRVDRNSIAAKHNFRQEIVPTVWFNMMGFE